MIILLINFYAEASIQKYFIIKPKKCKHQGINYLYFRHYEQSAPALLVILDKIRFSAQNSAPQKSIDKY
jgi:hypothetical protein